VKTSTLIRSPCHNAERAETQKA